MKTSRRKLEDVTDCLHDLYIDIEEIENQRGNHTFILNAYKYAKDDKPVASVRIGNVTNLEYTDTELILRYSVNKVIFDESLKEICILTDPSLSLSFKIDKLKVESLFRERL